MSPSTLTTRSSNAQIRSAIPQGTTMRHADSTLYQRLLALCPLKSSATQYLLQRAISAKTISQFKVGQVSDSKSTAARLIDEFGYTRADEAGVLFRDKWKRSVRLIFPNHSLVFPFLDHGRIIYMQARSLQHQSPGRKWWNLVARPRQIFNVDALSSKAAERIAICEGVIDTMSAVEFDYTAFGILGIHMRLAVNQLHELRGKEVHILLDWDSPGEAAAITLQQELARYGIHSVRKTRPSPRANDLNDYLREQRGLST